MYIGAPRRGAPPRGRAPSGPSLPISSRSSPSAPRSHRGRFERGLKSAASAISKRAGNPAARGSTSTCESLFDTLAPRTASAPSTSARPRPCAPPSRPATGLFTARSLARMYAALAGGRGARRCAADVDPEPSIVPPSVRSRFPQQRGATVTALRHALEARLPRHRSTTRSEVPGNAFGHFGFGGSGAWADPSRELAVALIVNSGLGTPFGDLRIAQISAAALRSVRARRQSPRRSRAPARSMAGASLSI